MFPSRWTDNIRLTVSRYKGPYRVRRRYSAPQTPLQRVAELRPLPETLDPLELSPVIQSEREGIFLLNTTTGYILTLQDDSTKVTFLNCLTGGFLFAWGLASTLACPARA